MAGKVNPIPEGFHTITPYFIVNDGTKFIEFLKEAFDAVENHRSTTPGGIIMHAQLKIGDSFIMMGQSTGEWKSMTCTIYMYVPDIDSVYSKALKAGGKTLREPTNEFYGDRVCGIEDPFGNQWWIAAHVEDVSPEEMKKREEEMMKQREGKN
jgi:PhnB protein